MFRPVAWSLCLLVGVCFGATAQSQAADWITPQTSGVDASLRGIAVRNASEAWVGGAKGTLLHTDDAGQSWGQVQPPGSAELDFRDIALPAPGVVVVMAAGPGAKSRIYRSEDNGMSWQQTLVNQDENGFFNAMTFVDDREAWLVGDPIDAKLDLYHSTDAGRIWRRQQGPEMIDGEYGFAASGTNIVAVEKNLFIATGAAQARVLRSTDRGVSWKPSTTPISHGKDSAGIFSIAFRDAQHGVVVGGDYKQPEVDDGNVAYTRDAGLTWRLAQPKGEIPHKACVRHLRDQTWLAVGRTGIAVTRDDGKTWQTISEQGFFTFDYDPVSGVGWMAGGDGRIARFTFPPN